MRIQKVNERWFDVPEDPDGARIKIRNLSPGELSEINDQAFIQDISYNKGDGDDLEPIITNKTDSKLFRELPIKKCVVAWENFFDEDGNVMECKTKNIERAINMIDGFVEGVNEHRKLLADIIAKEKEEQAKNSKGSASTPAK